MKTARIAIFLSIVLVGLAHASAFADTQMMPATTAADDASTGTTIWSPSSFPSNAAMFDGSTSVTTHYLKVAGFGFTVPATAVIQGIAVSISRSVTIGSGGTVVDHSVVIVKGGTLVGTEHAAVTSWPVSSTAANYGGASDLWGQAWTPADINSSTFGAAVSAIGSGGVPFVLDGAQVQSAQITVTYFVPCPATLDNTGCDASFTSASLKVDERKPGKEKLQVSLGKGGALDEMAMGDFTAASGPMLSLCVYDAASALVATLVVDAAGNTCGTKQCWTSAGGAYPDGKGFAYKDSTGAMDGVTSVKLTGGIAGKSKARVKASGKNGPLPLGTAAALDGDASASVQIRDSNSPQLCLSATLASVTANSGGLFQAKK